VDLTTLARVKARRDLAGTGDDALLSEFISAVSQTVEQLMHRHVLEAERTEVVRLERYQRTATLPGRPLSAVSAVTVGYRPSLDGSSVSDPSTYDVLEEQGQVRLNWAPPWAPTYVSVTYTGGMAADTAAFIAAYPELADAVDVEVVHRWNRRKNPGSESTKVGEATVARTGAYGLHEHLRELVARYKIRRV
jgi:hypothetical protein